MKLEIAEGKSSHGLRLRCVLEKHENRPLTAVTWSSDGQWLASASSDNLILIWDAGTGELIQTLVGRSHGFMGLAWYQMGRQIITVSADNMVGFWSVTEGELVSNVKANFDSDFYMFLSPDGDQIASTTFSGTIKLWGANKLDQLKMLTGHFNIVSTVAWSPDMQTLVSGSNDHTIRTWDINTEKQLYTFEGHSAEVTHVAWSNDGRLIASGSKDSTIRLWDKEAGRLIGVLEGHKDEVKSVCFSHDDKFLASKSLDGSIIVWRCDTWQIATTFEESTGQFPGPNVAFNPKSLTLATFGKGDSVVRIWELDTEVLLGGTPQVKSVRYRNAKVVLVGDTGVGKTGLGKVLAGEKFKATISSHGRHVRQLELKRQALTKGQEEIREILLWDLAGQPEFRIVHQLSLDQANLALVLFDGSSPTDPFKGVAFWSRALRQAKGSDQLIKFLIAARTDVSPLYVTEERMSEATELLGFQKAFRTSAATGVGVQDLLKAIKESIEWENLPFNISEQFFKKTKDFLLDWKRRGDILKTVSDIERSFRHIYFNESFNEDDFRAVLTRVEAHDLIKTLSFGDYVLLEPELLDNYASAMARAAREQPDGLGYLDEQAAREGWFDFGSLERVDRNEERVILQSAVELFIEKDLAISDEGRLVFPSQFNRELPEHPEVEGVTVSYQFEGAILNAYTTLVVRLYHSQAFSAESLWKSAALFMPFGRKSLEYRCGFILKEQSEAVGLLTVFFGQQVADDTKILFLKYVHEHLSRKSLNGKVKRERIYRCPICLNEVKDRNAVQSRLERGLTSIPCLYCSKPTDIMLTDLLEETFGKADRFLDQVRQLDREIDIRVSNESKEMILVGKVMTLVAEAGDIYRPTVMYDWGIDGEIEFRDDSGEASGERIYVQLKSGGSYLRRRKDGVRTFHIPKERHIKYWQSHKYPVYLVILDNDQKMYWMNITEYLATRTDKAARTIVFTGEELSVQAVKSVKATTLALMPRATKSVDVSQETRQELESDRSVSQETLDVFLAYDNSDVRLVEFIAGELSKLKLNPRLIAQQIPPSRWFQEVIDKAIHNAKATIIFIGSSGAGRWPILELRSFISQCIEAKLPAITVMLPGGGDIPNDLLFLRELEWVQFGESINDPKAIGKLASYIGGTHSKKYK